MSRTKPKSRPRTRPPSPPADATPASPIDQVLAALARSANPAVRRWAERLRGGPRK